MIASSERSSRRVGAALVSAFMAMFLLLGATTAGATRRPADADEGGAIFAQHCQACHGAYGRGDGPVAADLVGGVPDLGGRFRRGGVDAAMSVVLSGQNAMPAFAEVLDSYQARRALRHLAVVAQQDPPRADPEPPLLSTPPPDAPPADAPPAPEAP